MYTTDESFKDLLYEIEMLDNTVLALNNPNAPKDQFFKNLLVESLAIHTRVLLDFFYCDEKKYKDDIIAQDFLPSNIEWSKIRPPMADILKESKNKVGKQIAHLSLDRIKLDKCGKKGWNVSEMYNEMKKVITCFFKNIKTC